MDYCFVSDLECTTWVCTKLQMKSCINSRWKYKHNVMLISVTIILNPYIINLHGISLLLCMSCRWEWQFIISRPYRVQSSTAKCFPSQVARKVYSFFANMLAYVAASTRPRASPCASDNWQLVSCLDHSFSQSRVITEGTEYLDSDTTRTNLVRGRVSLNISHCPRIEEHSLSLKRVLSQRTAPP